MTQVSSYSVGPGPRADVRQGFNAILAALRDGNAGATEPPYPVPYMTWIDTSGATPVVKYRNAANTGWIGGATVDGSITNAQLAQVATATFKGRVSALTGPVEDLTPAQMRGALDIPGTENLLLNGMGRVNQRGYVSGTATTIANQFTLDRWFVNTLGQNVTVIAGTTGNLINAPSGGISQVIEGANIVSGTYCLSWSGSATATVNGTSVANGGTTTLTGGVNATVTFFGGVFSQARLGWGKFPAFNQWPHISAEVLMCQRYFERRNGYISTSSASASVNQRKFFSFSQKRAAPTVTTTFVSGLATSPVVVVAFVDGCVIGVTSSASNHSCTFTFDASAELTA